MRIQHHHIPAGFTLVELLVVVTIIVILLALLTPALDRAIEHAERAVCGANQKAIVSSSTMYAMENRHDFVSCRGRQVEMSFVPRFPAAYDSRPDDQNVDWLAALASVGLASSSPVTLADGVPHHVPGKMWLCPSSDYEGFWDPDWGQQYCTGYQYYGGIEIWRSRLGGTEDAGIPSRSPVRLNKSHGEWVLTADRSILINDSAVATLGGSAWDDGGLPRYWGGNPNHKTETMGPAGNNQSHADGSVGWVDGRRLINIHSYKDNGRQIGFFYQKDLGGWTPPDAAHAENYLP